MPSDVRAFEIAGAWIEKEKALGAGVWVETLREDGWRFMAEWRKRGTSGGKEEQDAFT